MVWFLVVLFLHHCIIASLCRVSCHSAQGAVTQTLFVCALVACMAAYADADAVALAWAAAVAFVAFVALASAAWRTIAAAIIWPERLRVLFEQQHELMQCAKLAADLCDDWLNE